MKARTPTEMATCIVRCISDLSGGFRSHTRAVVGTGRAWELKQHQPFDADEVAFVQGTQRKAMDHGGAGNEKVRHADGTHALLTKVLCNDDSLVRNTVIQGVDNECIEQVLPIFALYHGSA